MAWSPDTLPIRPGVYTRFQDEAQRSIQGGPRGIVAIPLLTYNGTAEPKKFYKVSRMSEANQLFGADNIASIRDAFDGGASQVLVYTMPTSPLEDDYDDMLEAFMTQDFNVFVLDREHDEAIQTKVVTWLSAMRNEDKHVLAVFGGDSSADEELEAGNARSTALADDYSVNLISGVEWLGNTYSSAEYAPYIAGLIAGTPINQTITYKTVRADDVTKRLKNSEIEDALEAGSLVLVNDGDRVRVEKGIVTTGQHIRSIVTRQTILNDLPRILKSEAVAQIDNTEDGRASVVSMIKRYLEMLEQESAIMEPDAYVDPENPPQQDAAFFVVEYTDVYSMERIFLTVKRQG